MSLRFSQIFWNISLDGFDFRWAKPGECSLVFGTSETRAYCLQFCYWDSDRRFSFTSYRYGRHFLFVFELFESGIPESKERVCVCGVCVRKSMQMYNGQFRSQVIYEEHSTWYGQEIVKLRVNWTKLISGIGWQDKTIYAKLGGKNWSSKLKEREG